MPEGYLFSTNHKKALKPLAVPLSKKNKSLFILPFLHECKKGFLFFQFLPQLAFFAFPLLQSSCNANIKTKRWTFVFMLPRCKYLPASGSNVTNMTRKSLISVVVEMIQRRLKKKTQTEWDLSPRWPLQCGRRHTRASPLWSQAGHWFLWL